MKNIEILSKLIAVDTQIQNSTLEAVEWIKSYLSEYGVHAEFIYNKDKSRASLLATVGDKNSSGYIFSGHLDTVPADDSFYKQTAFKLLKEGDKYYGRGVCDMKGSIACFLSQVPNILKSGKTAHLVLTHDEEGGFEAIKQLIDDTSVSKFLSKQKGCIVMEPTNIEPVVSHKGCRFLNVDVIGKSGHSSNPSICIDAIEGAVKSYNIITSKFNELSVKYGKNNNYIEPLSTLTVGKFNGGEAINTVSANANYSILTRENPKCDFDSFWNNILSDIKLNAKISKKQNLYVLPFKSTLDEKFLNYLGDIKHVSYGTEAGFFEKIGVPTVVCGPGDIAQAHTKDEYIYASQLDLWNDKILEIINYDN